METRSIYRFARISPFKAREVTREIQGLPVKQALDLLAFTPKKAAGLVAKTLKSAVANAENNHQLDVDRLVVAEAHVGKSIQMRRFHARGRGRSASIVKPFSHLTVVVRERAAEAKAKAEKPAKAA